MSAKHWSSSGIQKFDLVDDDKVCLTNLNRQIIATRKTVGQYKVDVMRDRILEINPDAEVMIHKCFFLPDNADEFPFADYDYVVDAVDNRDSQDLPGYEMSGDGHSDHQRHGSR